MDFLFNFLKDLKWEDFGLFGLIGVVLYFLIFKLDDIDKALKIIVGRENVLTGMFKAGWHVAVVRPARFLLPAVGDREINNRLDRIMPMLESIKSNQDEKNAVLQTVQEQLAYGSTQLSELKADVGDLKSGLSEVKDEVLVVKNEAKYNGGKRTLVAAVKDIEVLVKRLVRQAAATSALSDVMEADLDAELNCTDWSKSFLEFLNIQESDLEDRNWMTGIIHDDDMALVLRKWNQAIQFKTHYDNKQRLLIRGKDYVICRVRGVPLLNDDGTLAGFKVTIKPI